MSLPKQPIGGLFLSTRLQPNNDMPVLIALAPVPIVPSPSKTVATAGHNAATSMRKGLPLSRQSLSLRIKF